MKLPPLTNRPAAQLPTSNPALAEADYNSRQSVIDAVQGVAADAAERHVEYQKQRATAQYADEVSEFERGMATRLDFSAQDIRDMGLDDVIDVQDAATGEDLSSIPKYKVYAIAKERLFEDMRERYGSGISSARQRQAWEESLRPVERQQLEQAVVATEKMAREHQLAEKQADLQTAINSRQFQTARDILSDQDFRTMLGPKGVQEAQDSITTAEVEAEFRNVMTAYADSGNVAGLRAEAARLREDETGAQYGTLDDKELNAWADQFDRIADATERAAKAGAEDVENRARSIFYEGFYAKMRDGTLTAGDIAGLSSLPYMRDTDIKDINKSFDNYLKNRSPYAQEDDPIVASKLRELMVSGASDLEVKQALTEAIPHLSESTYAAMDKQRIERTDPAQKAGLSSVKQRVDDLLMGIGLDPNAKSNNAETREVLAYRRAVDAALRQEQAAKGNTPLSPDEATRIVNKAFVRHKYSEPASFLGVDYSRYDKPIFEVIADEHPDDFNDIMLQLEDRIRSARGGNLYDQRHWAAAYKDWRKQQGK